MCGQFYAFQREFVAFHHFTYNQLESPFRGAMQVVWLELEVYSGRHPISKRTWDTVVMKVRKGDSTSHCASRGKEMQKTLG